MFIDSGFVLIRRGWRGRLRWLAAKTGLPQVCHKQCRLPLAPSDRTCDGGFRLVSGISLVFDSMPKSPPKSPPKRPRFQPVDHTPALRHLRQVDPQLARLIDAFGDCDLAQSPVTDSVLSALVKSIIFQRISIKAANTVYQRFLNLYPEGFPTAAQMLAMPEANFRSIGLPLAKVHYLKDLALHVEQGLPDMTQIQHLSDREIIQTLTVIKGIGEWSVQMLLMFQLQRWDVLPCGDVGLQLAMRDVYGLAAAPKPAQMRAIAAPWQPYRTIACWYLWRHRDAASQAILQAFERG